MSSVLSSEVSKSRRVYLLLRDEIVAGRYRAGARLPSEPRLAAEHRVARVTVRRALDGLQRDGLVTRRVGSGTFVEGPATDGAVIADFANMLSQIGAMGRNTKARLVRFGYEQAPVAVAAALGLPDGAIVQASVRVRSLDGAPFSYLRAYVPERIGRSFEETDLARTALLTLLERSGAKPDHASQTVGASAATPEIAAALGVPVGEALLSIARTVFDRQGRGIEHLVALYRPDRYRLNMRLARRGPQGARRWQPAPSRHPEDTKGGP